MCAAQVVRLASDDPRWLDWARSQPQANCFHHPAWARLLQGSYGCPVWLAVLMGEGGDILAGVPVAEVSRPLGGRCWVSLPFSDHCQALGEGAEALLAALTAAGQAQRMRQLEFRWDYAGSPGLAVRDEYLLHRLPIDDVFDRFSRRIHPMHQRNVRAAQRHGVQIELTHDLDGLRAFYRLHLLTRRRQGVPVQPWHFFERLGRELLAQELGFVLLACYQREVLAGAVFLRWNQTLTYKFGASDPQQLGLRPNDLLFWEAVRWACEHDCRVLDLGRTDVDNPGLQDFKRRWGAEETVLRYSYLRAPGEQRLKHGMQAALAKLIRVSPLWFCRGVGELLYRYAG